MTTSAPTLDLSGLSPEAVAAVTAVVEQLRAVQTPPPAPQSRFSHLREGEIPEQWVERDKARQATLVSRNPHMDDSRDSIYD
jgi:hypothetical protein